MPFLLRFVLRFAIGELATIANRKKVAIRTDFLFLGSWKGPEAVLGCYGLDAERGGLNLIRCWVVVDPDAERGGSGAGGRVDSMQCQGIAQPRRLGAVRVPCQGIAWVRHRDVAPLPC